MSHIALLPHYSIQLQKKVINSLMLDDGDGAIERVGEELPECRRHLMYSRCTDVQREGHRQECGEALEYPGRAMRLGLSTLISL